RSLLQNLYSIGSGGAVQQPQVNADEAIDIDLDASRRNSTAPPLEAIDIDLDASRRMSKAPGPGASAVPSPSPSPLPSPSLAPLATSSHQSASVVGDPFAARASGSFKRPPDDDETQRVQRSPAPTPTPAAN